MVKKEYEKIAAELEVTLPDGATIAAIKEAICDALITERSEQAEQIAGLAGELETAALSIKTKATVLKIGGTSYRYIGVKHLYNLQTITAELLANDTKLAEACVKSEVGFLVAI